MLIAFLQFEKVLPNLKTLGNPKEVILMYKKYSKTSTGAFRKKQFQTNVAFCSDLDLIKQKFSNQGTSGRTLSELLVSFLSFFAFSFKPREHVISINHPENINWLKKEEYIEECRLDETLQQPGFVDKIDDWTFMIIDPFDKTYNPGKQVDAYSNEREYIQGFKSLVMKCI